MIENLHLYLAMSDWQAQSRMEDLLVLAGFDVSTFPTPQSLWEHFQTRPARFVIIDRMFADGTSGLDTVKKIRDEHLQPYVYILVRSTIERLSEIEEALAAGADDCLVAFNIHDSFQVHSRILVGLRWLEYLDSLSDRQTDSVAGPSAPREPAEPVNAG